VRTPLSQSIFLLAVLFGLVLAASFLAAAEAALLRVSRVRLEVAAEGGDRSSSRLLRLVHDLPRVLNSVLLVMLMVQVGAATLAGFIAQRHFGSTGVTVVSVLLTLVMFVYAEAIPKTLAVRRPMATARFVSIPVAVVAMLTRPVVSVLLVFADWQAPGKGIPSAATVTEAELRRLAAEAAAAGEIAPADLDLIERSFRMGDTRVSAVMVPRPSIVAIPADTPLHDALDRAIQSGHRRLPVLGSDPDQITGVVRLHDLVAAASAGAPTTITTLQRPVLTVPESKPVHELLKDMQASGHHLAAIVDEHGATVGIATIEDVIGQLVGQISKTDDRQSPPIRALAPGKWTVDASTDLHHLEEEVGAHLPSGDWRTVAGMVIGAAGRIPKEGDLIEIPGFAVTVTRVDRRRVARVEVTALPSKEGG
jgi:putative hemolysin